MYKLYIFKLLANIILISLLASEPLYAASGSVVVSQIQLGNSASAKNELVEMYNNNASDVEVTDWCLYYQSISLVQNKMVCITPSAANIHIFLPGNSYMLAVSNELSLYDPLALRDMKFSAAMSGTGGYVKLTDATGSEIDKVGWGTSTPEINLVPPAPNGKVLSRKVLNNGILQDTDVNSDDFEITLPRSTYSYGALYEIEDVCGNLDGIQSEMPEGYQSNENSECILPPPDVCPNLDGLQTAMPDSYQLDESGNCQVDVCLNVEGLQMILPDGLEIDGSGNCVQYDECVNLPDIQTAIPEDYIRGIDNTCNRVILPLQITELLPNSVGNDDGNEFIELFNPNNKDVELNDYQLVVGAKIYSFSNSSIIKTGGYEAFYNDDIKFTLVNTTSSVYLKSVDESFAGEIVSYLNPSEGLSWALINETWQYTNQLTPGSENLPSVEEEGTAVSTAEENELKPCAEGEYRNPETNRCRKIISDYESSLVPCKQGQYRNEETGRCRNIASDVATLIPCAEGQERNPTTNRCRSVATVLGTSTTLKPCPAGQERNPETNRCRKITSSVMPAAAYAVKKNAGKGSNPILWWSLVAIGTVAVGYGVWEWRKELGRLFQKVGSMFSK